MSPILRALKQKQKKLDPNSKPDYNDIPIKYSNIIPHTPGDIYSSPPIRDQGLACTVGEERGVARWVWGHNFILNSTLFTQARAFNY